MASRRNANMHIVTLLLRQKTHSHTNGFEYDGWNHSINASAANSIVWSSVIRPAPAIVTTLSS